MKPGHRYSIQTPMLLAWCQIVARSRMRANKLGIPKNLVITAIPMFQGGFFQILPSTSVMFFSFQNFPNGKKILTVSCFTSQSFSELLEICGLSKILVWTSLNCENNLPHLLIGIGLTYLQKNDWNHSPRRHTFRRTFICHILKTGPD